MTTLGDLVVRGVLRFNDGYRTKQAEHAQTGFRILRAGDVNDGTIQPFGPDFVSSDFAGSIGEKVARAGDVVLTTKGTVGRVGYVSAVHEPVVYSPQVCFFRSQDQDVVVQPFLRYWLQSPEFTGQSSYLKGASDMAPYISLRDLSSTTITLPEAAVQRAIAQVLGALDDKIAANARVAAAADGLVRGMVEQFGGSDVTTIGAIATTHRAQVGPPFADTEYVGLEHVPRRHMWMTDSGSATGLTSGKFIFEPGDVLFGKLRPYFHKVVVADRRGVCSTDILVVRPKTQQFAGLVWALLASDAVVERLSAMTEGTRMPRTNWADLAACEVPWPRDEEAAQLSQYVQALGARASAAEAESRGLTTLRDALLPNLMSGQLAVCKLGTTDPQGP